MLTVGLSSRRFANSKPSPLRAAIRRTAKVLDFVGAPERWSSVRRRPVEVARERGAVSTLAMPFRALESSVVGQGVDILHGHNNFVDHPYLGREPLVGRILPVLNVVLGLKALLS